MCDEQLSSIIETISIFVAVGVFSCSLSFIFSWIEGGETPINWFEDRLRAWRLNPCKAIDIVMNNEQAKEEVRQLLAEERKKRIEGTIAYLAEEDPNVLER